MAAIFSTSASRVLRHNHSAPQDWCRLFAAFEEPVPGVSTEVAPNDTMFVPTWPDHYARVGQSAFRCIKLALFAAGKQEVRSILDLPCGHGRVQRVLRVVFPDARVTACDLDRDGVDYCGKTFGATPVYSEEDPKFITIQDQFDLIWCGSLLTHLDRQSWPRFFRFFESRLNTGGVCVFSVHGRHSVTCLRTQKMNYGLADVATILEEYDRDGFGYQGYPSHTLQNYGISLSSASWVMNQLMEHTRLRLVSYQEMAWDNHQDVVACVRP